MPNFAVSKMNIILYYFEDRTMECGTVWGLPVRAHHRRSVYEIYGRCYLPSILQPTMSRK